MVSFASGAIGLDGVGVGGRAVIDTGGSSDNVNGMKMVIPILSAGMSINVSGADIVGWSYDGTQNGDALYVESTSTAAGLPKKTV